MTFNKTQNIQHLGVFSNEYRRIRYYAVSMLIAIGMIIMPQSAFANCDMTVDVTNQTPSVVAPGSDIIVELTINELLGQNCDGNFVNMTALKSNSTGSTLLPTPDFAVTNIYTSTPQWTFPSNGYTTDHFWGILESDLVIPALGYKQEVSINVAPSVPEGIYPACFRISVNDYNKNPETPVYTPASDENLRNNLACTKIVVAWPETSECCDCCCEEEPKCLVPNFFNQDSNECLISSDCFEAILLLLLFGIFIMTILIWIKI